MGGDTLACSLGDLSLTNAIRCMFGAFVPLLLVGVERGRSHKVLERVSERPAQCPICEKKQATERLGGSPAFHMGSQRRASSEKVGAQSGGGEELPVNRHVHGQKHSSESHHLHSKPAAQVGLTSGIAAAAAAAASVTAAVRACVRCLLSFLCRFVLALLHCFVLALIHCFVLALMH
eukprot:1160424-Pelagomonas_calceolata.AAC.1